MTRDRERVQRKAAAEVDERVAQPFLAQVPSHVRIEDLLVKPKRRSRIHDLGRSVMTATPLRRLAGREIVASWQG
jgi:hypothetical protein